MSIMAVYCLFDLLIRVEPWIVAKLISRPIWQTARSGTVMMGAIQALLLERQL